MKYFKLEEFKCKCGQCSSTGKEMDALFLQKLDLLRENCGFPFIVTSGYRCREYNLKVSQSGESGPHTIGKAADIGISGPEAYKLVSLAFKAGFYGIGIQQKGKSRFVHVDTLTPQEAPRPAIWSY